MRSAHRVTALVGASVFGFLLSTAGTADAAWRRFHASACIADNPADIRIDESKGGLYNNSSTDWIVLSCPVVEDSTLWVDSVTALTVGVTSNSSVGVWSLACVTRDTVTGGTCGTVAAAPSAGNHILSPDLSAWHGTWFGEPNQADYPYIRVLLFAASGFNYNAIRGYHITT